MSGPVRKWSRPRGSGSASSPLVHEMAPLMTRGAGGVLHDEAESIRRRAFLSGAFVAGTVILMVVAGFLYDPFHSASRAPRADVSRDRSGQSEPTSEQVDQITSLMLPFTTEAGRSTTSPAAI